MTDDIKPVFETEAPVVAAQPTPLEAVAQDLIQYLGDGSTAWQASSLLALKDRLEAEVTRAQSVRIATPRLLEVTGNVSESELAARHMEAKAKGAAFHASRDQARAANFHWIADCFLAAAQEFRAGMHLPQVCHEGKVIPYNDSNDTGVRHAAMLRTFFTDVYGRNLKAGWWSDITRDGAPKKRNIGELLMLFVTEIAESYSAWRLSSAQHVEPDDKLPQYPGFGVELADLGIRWADLCGAALAGNLVFYSDADNPGDLFFQQVAEIADEYEKVRKTPAAVGEEELGDFMPAMDIAEMTDAKLNFNANRPDHKIENRLKEDGKKT